MTYRDAGVDIGRGAEAVRRIKPLAALTHRAEVTGEIGGFAGGFRWSQPGTLLAGADGVGSKLLVAQAVGRHDTIGVDLVAMNVNDIAASGGEPLFFLDYIAIGRLDPDRIEQIVSGVVRGCQESGCTLLGGETAEMPDIYSADGYDLAGFCVGQQSVSLPSPDPGDRIIGLASSGFHSNGYALLRHIVGMQHLDWQAHYPATGTQTLGEALLTPTVIYVKVLQELWKRNTLHGMAHITGGGIVENLPRTLVAGQGAVIDRSRWEVPPLVRWFQEMGKISDAEMFRTFNMGLGMMVVAPPQAVSEVLQVIREFSLNAWDVGEVVDTPGVVLA
ncbi:MAG: phosphoribosylformylglycinamidine cyclo-ligase [Sulfobacillus benefaciens]|uniref:Phosphoribosylformylglycinamidine cyclo-ligase n=1 Tax=Sulfobacillus benefaciens TaxID=453960 RepID=A0A2T2XFG5_9FIRM|nr:MAG: phosphoribosylformylglycinamidine cyclo-ligase [Sulfobacillus benefaciens]